MTRVRRFLGVSVVALALSGCGGTGSLFGGGTVESDLYVACKGFSSTEQALRPFKDEMTDDQFATMQTAVNIAVPICVQPVGEVADPAALVGAVKAQLAALLKLQGEV